MTQLHAPGLLLTLEGIEGVGKSTVAQYIVETVRAAGIEIVATREPGGTPIAEQIRQILLDADASETLLPKTEMLLLFAGRNQHIETVIKPALAAGKWVLSDRFTDASFAYQGAGRGVDLKYIEALADCVQEDLQVDCVFWLDAPVEVALERAKGRGELDRFEQEDIAFFTRARDMYAQRAATLPYYKRIDASLDVAAVKAQIKQHLVRLLSKT